MKRLIIGIAVIGLLVGFAGLTMAAEQGKSQSQTSGSSEQNLGPQNEAQSSPGFEGANRQRGGKTMGGELSEKISPQAHEQQMKGTRSEGNDPVEQQSPGPGSGKSSGVGAGQ